VKKALVMQFLSLRPTFDTVIPCSKTEVLAELGKQLRGQSWNWIAHEFDGYIELHIPDTQTRYWSPHLSLSFEEKDGATWIHGRFAPRQEVWTLVWVAYLAFAFGAFFSLLFALSAWHAGQSTVAWWMIPLCMFGILFLYIVSYIGQSWSYDQMESLRVQCQRLLQLCCPNLVN
jgi:hypothetical protein